ncbi:pantetheine-phosphate adenylyltransferase [Neokomagataea thailandica]|uniref:Phosphopantetheine adenylyltransferase n=1 Tax=Neokomagataea tanensis NBRC 106556 TaxID=1223519 RepID=A0ABQ0QKU2_9PROT|nr:MULTISPECIES: pantetheine-phosphate adenylyltransferase [Neokomagataea]GBR48396.1 pantetheine-phosphate adenylyltransferase [Neokomagataea tanensis NBRC 106556]
MALNPRMAFYPGTFDPVTYGHMDIIARAARLFDKLVVGVGVNGGKQPLLTRAERLALLRQEVSKLPEAARITVVEFDTLLVDAVRAVGAGAVVRGLRSAGDFDFECQISGVMRRLAPEIEMVLLLSADEHRATASHIVKDIASFGGDISSFVSEEVARVVLSKSCREAT